MLLHGTKASECMLAAAPKHAEAQLLLLHVLSLLHVSSGYARSPARQQKSRAL